MFLSRGREGAGGEKLLLNNSFSSRASPASPAYPNRIDRTLMLILSSDRWRSLSGQQKNQARNAENHIAYFDFSVNA
jgi:hypothetical protein